MCLTNLTTKKAKRAKEDITCYKVLKTMTMFSPFQKFKYSFNKKVESALRHNEYIPKEVYIGLHTFKTLEAAEHCLRLQGGNHKESIFEATIPKGAKYYEGLFDHIEGLPSYASTELIIKKAL